MPRFEPFRALRYAAGTDLAAVTSPPYDVLTDAEVLDLAARDRHNVVHVDDPLVVHTDAPDPYAAAGHLLRDWVRQGVLVADDAPSFTIHRMRFTDATGTDRETVGVLGGLEVVAEGAGGVLPHERVTPKASTDRLDLTRATDANLSPIWGLALAAGLTDLLTEPAEPIGTLVADGVTHTLERVTDPARVAAIAALVGSDDVLIADGHHRYGVARSFLAEVASPGAEDPAERAVAADAELTLAYVGELAPDQLSVAAIHRVYTGVDEQTLRAALDRCFTLSPAPAPDEGTLAEMDRRGELVLVGAGGAQWLSPRPGAFDGIRSLDGAWLEHALDGIPVEVTYQHGVGETADAVARGRATAAVLIRPPSVAEIMRTAREGLLMPPKSTFFTPKLPTGLVIRDLLSRP